MLKNEDFIIQFMEYYNMGFSTTQICNFLGEDRGRGYKLLNKMNLPSHKPIANKITKEDIDNIKELYQSGKTIQQISDIINIKSGTVNYWVRKLGIARPNGRVPDCKQDYFKDINTPSKAYFLGLLYADGGFIKSKNKNGYIKRTLSLELKTEDKYILEEFKKQLESSIPIKRIKKEETMFVNKKEYNFIKDNCYFRVGCKELIEDLISWGCIENKTKELKNVPVLSSYLIRFFLLGFFDGDGIASYGKRAYMGFCGTESMMKSISEILNKELNIEIKKPYYNKSNKIFYLHYTKKEEIEKIYHYFYDEIDIPFLIRKKEKIEKYLNANTEIT